MLLLRELRRDQGRNECAEACVPSGAGTGNQVHVSVGRNEGAADGAPYDACRKPILVATLSRECTTKPLQCAFCSESAKPMSTNAKHMSGKGTAGARIA